MQYFKDVDYNKNVLYESGFTASGKPLFLYYQKSLFQQNNTEQHFIKLVSVEDGVMKIMGYIYFYLNDDLKVSDFIGTYIKPEYRNNGFASFLVAKWIDFCFNNGYDFLGTNQSQRKPFLLYLLKTYGFEIFDEHLYLTNPNVIDICAKRNDKSKYLLFRNPEQEKTFMSGSVALEDNYQAIKSLEADYSYLDSVILSKNYELKRRYKAEEKAELVINRFK